MFCDKKLLSMVNFVSKDNTRMALKNIRFEGEKVFATNGNILAITSFNQIEDIGVEPPVKQEEKPFCVSAESITKAFKNLSKKSSFLHTQGVFVAENVAASFSDFKNCALYREDVEQDYPDVKRVILEKSVNDTVLGLSKDCLETLVNTMKSNSHHYISLRIPPMCSKGHVVEAVSFSMGDSNDGIKGIVMPYRPSEAESNTEHTLILQEDVSEMLDLLCLLMPDDERILYFAEKYKNLVNTALPLAA